MGSNLSALPPRRDLQSGGPLLSNATALDDVALERLQTLLDGLPEDLQPLDVSALDGFLCGVLLQPRPVPAERWMRHVTDLEGRAAPDGARTEELHALVLHRHAELGQAIEQRQWFDPWIYQLDDSGSPSESVLPWVAGFAAACELFPELTALGDPELVEPLALLFMHFDPEDLEDADALAAVIETLEPPADLAEAVQDVVRALMLIADVARPLPKAATPPRRRPLAPRPARKSTARRS